jgi:glycosyltransferase involved in cell wall biosynthesis
VDGYSTDKTLEIVKEFNEKFHNITVLKEKGSRGSARQKAISQISTEWFVFVDSDVVLCHNWFQKAQKFMKANVGAIWGVEIWSVLKNMTVLELFKRVTMKIFGKRGGTHDLLVRTQAVHDIQIPPVLHVYEDAYIKSWIARKDFKVISTYEPYCIHYRPPIVWTIKKSITLVANDLKYAIKYPQLLLSYAFYAIIVLHQSLRRAKKPK